MRADRIVIHQLRPCNDRLEVDVVVQIADSRYLVTAGVIPTERGPRIVFPLPTSSAGESLDEDVDQEVVERVTHYVRALDDAGTYARVKARALGRLPRSPYGEARSEPW